MKQTLIFTSIGFVAICGFIFSLPKAHAAILFVASSSGQSAGGSGAATSTAINTSGKSNLACFIAASDFSQDATTDSVTDTQGNTWHHLTNQANGNSDNAIWYSYGMTGSASHKFTVVGNYDAMTVQCFSGVQSTSDPFTSENGNGGSNNTLQTGSVTPSSTGDLFITGVASRNDSTHSINGGFTQSSDLQFNGGVSMGNAGAYLIATSTNSTDPTWTFGLAPTDSATRIAVFRQAVAASGASQAVSLTLANLGAGIFNAANTFSVASGKGFYIQ